MKKAVLYLRISLDRSGEGLGVDRQRELCQRHAAYKGWEVVGEYVDNSVSATSGKARPEYQRMIQDVEAGGIDVVVAWKLDRLTRRPIEIEEWIQLHESHGVNLATADGDLDLSTASGQTIAGILANIARGEMKSKSDRQKAAHAQRAAAGRPWSTVRMFGFEDDGVTHRPEEAEAIRGMYSDLIAGVPQRRIARGLNERGILSSAGKSWSQGTVRLLLMNPRNAGLRARLGEVVGPGVWDPIVPEETYRVAVSKMDGPASGGGRARYLLTGLARCGVCGGPMKAGSTARGVRQYMCTRAAHVGRNAERLEALVVGTVVGILSRPDARDLLTVRDGVDSAALAAEADVLRQRLDGLAVEFADGVLTGSQLAAVTARLRERIEGLEGQMRRSSAADALAPVLDSGEAAADAWLKLDVYRQRAIVDALMVVRVNRSPRGAGFRPECIELEPKGPTA
ncbi:recombinase family protein [Arthrobacter rhombi]|uniref:recombinase family protein n=1 Tax=Arthrobacter rhombi TaxID=71253 RepID=UPI003FD0F3DF